MSAPDMPPAGEAPRAGAPRAPLGPGEATIIFIGFITAQIATAVVGGAVLAFYLMIVDDADPATLTQAVNLATPYLTLASAICGAIVAAVLSALFIRVGARTTFRSAIGWAPGTAQQGIRAAVVGMMIALSYMGVAASLLPYDETMGHGPLVEMASTPGAPRLMWAILALVVAPPAEEFLFRGVLFSGFARRWSVTTAGALTTLLFCIVHLPEAVHYWPGLVAVAAMGIGTVVYRVQTGCVGPGIAMHAAYNGCIVFITFLSPTG